MNIVNYSAVIDQYHLQQTKRKEHIPAIISKSPSLGKGNSPSVWKIVSLELPHTDVDISTKGPPGVGDMAILAFYGDMAILELLTMYDVPIWRYGFW